MTADNTIKWIVNNNLLNDLAVHHELYLLLEKAYPKANSTSREFLLDSAFRLIDKTIKESTDIEPETFRYSLFRLLWWLDKSVGGECGLVKKRLIHIKKENPGWKVTDHPEFTHYMTSSLGYDSPINADELLKKNPEEASSYLVSDKDDDQFRNRIEDLHYEFQKAVTKDPDWSFKVADQLKSYGADGEKYFERLLWGWADANLTVEQWPKTLDFISSNESFFQYGRSLGRVLENGLNKKDYQIPYPFLKKAEKIAFKVWGIEESKNSEPDVITPDFVMQSINHSGGKLAEFFLQAISLHIKHDKTLSKRIPKPYRKKLKEVINGNSYTSSMARVNLATRLGFLFSIDSEWTIDNFIPLFDWENNESIARQVWVGFLGHGRWHDDLLLPLLPFYQQCFLKINNELKDQRKRLVVHVASISMLSNLQQVRGDWLNSFLSTVEASDREVFAGSIGSELRRMDDKRKIVVWKNWLSTYWDNRINGKPKPLSSKETGKMVRWAEYLAPVFQDIVDKICKLTDEYPLRFFFSSLKESGLLNMHPKESSRLLENIAKNTKTDHYHLGECINELITKNETHPHLKTALEAFASKGYSEATKFLTQLKHTDNSH